MELNPHTGTHPAGLEREGALFRVESSLDPVKMRIVRPCFRSVAPTERAGLASPMNKSFQKVQY